MLWRRANLWHAAVVALCCVRAFALGYAPSPDTLPEGGGPYSQLANYGYVGSLLSDDPADSLLAPDPSRRTHYPGNKVVVLVGTLLTPECRCVLYNTSRVVWAAQGRRRGTVG